MFAEEKREALNHQELLAHCEYDPLTGIFTRRRKHNRFPVGSIMGYKNPRGYIKIQVLGKIYQANQLAWFYVNGKWPDVMIDHRNRDPSDNRICNLRPANFSENGANRVGKNSTGFKGVSHSRRKFRATLKVHGRTLYIGLFDTAEQASIAYVAEAQKHFGSFARQN